MIFKPFRAIYKKYGSEYKNFTRILCILRIDKPFRFARIAEACIAHPGNARFCANQRFHTDRRGAHCAPAPLSADSTHASGRGVTATPLPYSKCFSFARKNKSRREIKVEKR